jgi:hypothetical protein
MKCTAVCAGVHEAMNMTPLPVATATGISQGDTESFYTVIDCH